MVFLKDIDIPSAEGMGTPGQSRLMSVLRSFLSIGSTVITVPPVSSAKTDC